MVQAIFGVRERVGQRDEQRVGAMLQAESNALIPGPPFVGEELDAAESVRAGRDPPRQIGLRGGSTTLPPAALITSFEIGVA